MKNTAVAVSFDPEKLDALKLYLFRKGADLEHELNDFLERSYQKTVPASIKDYLSAKQETPESPGRKPTNSSSRSAKNEN